MSDFLEQVVAERRADVAKAKAAVSEQELMLHARERALDPQERGGISRSPSAEQPGGGRFFHAVHRRSREHVAVIAEFKRRSPALGRGVVGLWIPVVEIDGRAEPFEAQAARTAVSYQHAGATAISVLTEPRHWEGSLDDLEAARRVTDLPILCKDVIVDEYQILQARAAGADAVLLIAEALSDDELRRFIRFAVDLGMDTLVEAHEPVAFGRAVASGSRLIGVNARNLRRPTEIDIGRVRQLHGFARSHQLLVAESGIRSVEDARLLPSRVDAILIGTALMAGPESMPLLRALAGIRRTVHA